MRDKPLEETEAKLQAYVRYLLLGRYVTTRGAPVRMMCLGFTASPSGSKILRWDTYCSSAPGFAAFRLLMTESIIFCLSLSCSSITGGLAVPRCSCSYRSLDALRCKVRLHVDHSHALHLKHSPKIHGKYQSLRARLHPSIFK